MLAYFFAQPWARATRGRPRVADHVGSCNSRACYYIYLPSEFRLKNLRLPFIARHYYAVTAICLTATLHGRFFLQFFSVQNFGTQLITVCIH